MNVRQALYIRTIAEEKGVTAAAKKLHISQPSLSQMLRQICLLYTSDAADDA